MKISMTSTIIFLFVLVLSPATGSATGTAYELLASYNFPKGLLPKGITGYDLDKSTGNFHLYMDGTCSFWLEGSYQLKYEPKMSGRISENRITELSGISVKVFFLWLNIVEVHRTGADIELSVGIASAGFPVEGFNQCPQCGCGLDCNRVNGMVSSF